MVSVGSLIDLYELSLIYVFFIDKSQAIKQKNTINARRGDRRNAKVPVKAKYDRFLLKAGLQSLSPASGGTSAFGMTLIATVCCFELY